MSETTFSRLRGLGKSAPLPHPPPPPPLVPDIRPKCNGKLSLKDAAGEGDLDCVLLLPSLLCGVFWDVCGVCGKEGGSTLVGEKESVFVRERARKREEERQRCQNQL